MIKIMKGLEMILKYLKEVGDKERINDKIIKLF